MDRGACPRLPAGARAAPTTSSPTPAARCGRGDVGDGAVAFTRPLRRRGWTLAPHQPLRRPDMRPRGSGQDESRVRLARAERCWRRGHGATGTTPSIWSRAVLRDPPARTRGHLRPPGREQAAADEGVTVGQHDLRPGRAAASMSAPGRPARTPTRMFDRCTAPRAGAVTGAERPCHRQRPDRRRLRQLRGIDGDVAVSRRRVPRSRSAGHLERRGGSSTRPAGT